MKRGGCAPIFTSFRLEGGMGDGTTQMKSVEWQDVTLILAL